MEWDLLETLLELSPGLPNADCKASGRSGIVMLGIQVGALGQWGCNYSERQQDQK